MLIHALKPPCTRSRTLTRVAFAVSIGIAWLVTSVHAQTGQTRPTPSNDPLVDACFASLGHAAVDTSACETALRATAAGQGATRRLARLHAALAMLYAQRDELRRARSEMEQALRLDPDDLAVRGNLGNLLLREGAYRAALDTYNQVIEELLSTDPHSALHAPVYLNRSLALRALGRYDESSKDVALYLAMIGDQRPSGHSQDNTAPNLALPSVDGVNPEVN